jgi:hypothetical protein
MFLIIIYNKETKKTNNIKRGVFHKYAESFLRLMCLSLQTRMALTEILLLYIVRNAVTIEVLRRAALGSEF